MSVVLEETMLYWCEKSGLGKQIAFFFFLYEHDVKKRSLLLDKNMFCNVQPYT